LFFRAGALRTFFCPHATYTHMSCFLGGLRCRVGALRQFLSSCYKYAPVLFSRRLTSPCWCFANSLLPCLLRIRICRAFSPSCFSVSALCDSFCRHAMNTHVACFLTGLRCRAGTLRTLVCPPAAYTRYRHLLSGFIASESIRCFKGAVRGLLF